MERPVMTYHKCVDVPELGGCWIVASKSGIKDSGSIQSVRPMAERQGQHRLQAGEKASETTLAVKPAAFGQLTLYLTEGEKIIMINVHLLWI